ncbi:MAG: efflux RND transporter permease subunit [Rhodocyclaceae bacterium]|nr:efflux RND transporter permease subunit [Rhodocyclaceae bacterium]
MSRSRASGPVAAVTGFCLRFRGAVVALMVLLATYGLYAFDKARYDVFPEFAPPQVTIQTEAMGLAPEQVEVLVTQPIENAINGVPGIATLRSQSIQGLSVITATFDPKSDIYRDRQNLAERLSALAAQLPTGVQVPTLSPLTSSVSMMLAIGLTSESRSLMDVRTAADWLVKPRLLAVPGVAKVSVFGGDTRELQIQLKRQQMLRYGLSLNEVLDAARRASGVRGAGFIDNANQRIVIQTFGQSIRAQTLGQTVVRQRDGINLTLADVANVREAPEAPIGAALQDGQPAVQLVISEQYGGDTMATTEALERVLTDLRPVLEAEKISLHADTFRPANFIAVATHNVKVSLAIGAVLVVIVVALFLANWRTSLIALSAIPLSLIAAVTIMVESDISLNTMTLGGLAIAIGLLVDDAIIVVENVYRRLQKNHKAAEPRAALDVISGAVFEVRSAVVYATLAIALVFLPVLTLPGLGGRLFAPLAGAYLLATLASLVVAVTVTPALCMILLPRGDLPEHESPLARRLKRHYQKGLQHVETHFRWSIAGVALLAFVTIASLPFLSSNFLPELKEGHYILHISSVPGTSLQESLRVGQLISERLKQLPFVRLTAQRTGRAEKSDDTWGTHYSEFDVDLKSVSTGEEVEKAEESIRDALKDLPGINFAVKTFLTERVEETLSGYTAAVVINVYGQDLDTLDAKARQVASILGQVSGATDVQIQSPPGTPEIGVRLRPEALSRWGFAPVEVLEAIQTAFQGTVVGQVYDGNRVFNVNVIQAPQERRSIADVMAMTVKNHAGVYVRLDQLADVFATSGRYAVLHVGARRVQAITSNVQGRDVGSFVVEAKRRIAQDMPPAPGYYVEFSGAAEAQAAATRDLIIHSLVAAAAIVLMLWIVLRRLRNVGLVLLNLPFAMTGGLIAVMLTGGNLTLGSTVGFVTLFGITLRNSVMLLSHYEYLVVIDGMEWTAQTAWEGASERLVPIMMTALATGLGLLPLALGSGDPGREIEGPMALVILGGLLTSTVLNLLAMPSLAWRYARFETET